MICQVVGRHGMILVDVMYRNSETFLFRPWFHQLVNEAGRSHLSQVCRIPYLPALPPCFCCTASSSYVKTRILLTSATLQAFCCTSKMSSTIDAVKAFATTSPLTFSAVLFLFVAAVVRYVLNRPKRLNLPVVGTGHPQEMMKDLLEGTTKVHRKFFDLAGSNKKLSELI